MTAGIYFIIVIVALAALYLIVPKVAGAYLKFRGRRVITCPETRRPAAIEVDASYAAVTAATNYLDLRLKSCSRWPEREQCGQECLLQVELSPEGCRLSNILTSWYAGKHCVSCGKQFGEIRWSDHKPALLGPEGHTVEWRDCAPEKVPDLLVTHFPVCWDCHITESFRGMNPTMITDRSRISPGVHRGMTV